MDNEIATDYWIVFRVFVFIGKMCRFFLNFLSLSVR